jgi:hypothetical protein
MQRPESGLEGTFKTYGPPATQLDCAPKVTQADKDSCRHENERVIEAPYQGTLMVRNLDTRKAIAQPLDAEGKFRVLLDPGAYEVCVNGECSDPIEIRMGKFATYGQRLPRPAAEPAKAPAGANAPVDPGAGASKSVGDTASAAR